MKKNVKIEILTIIFAFFLFNALYSQNDLTHSEEIPTPSNISIFGHDLFDNDLSKSGFSTVFYPERYTLGPGDKLGIYLSGKIQEDFSVVVNVEGKIYIPTVGVLSVNGKTLKDLRIFLIRKMSKFYDNFHVDVMLVEPKTVQVSVVGEVTRPGKYLLTAMNTVIDALNMAGGPLRGGSLRDVQLIRDGKLVESVDFYEFLLNPKHADISFLESGDRIYVPLTQARVYVSGELRRNKIFELKPGARERLSDIVNLAGGFTDYAFQEKIEISRAEETGERRVTYVDYQKIRLDENSAPNFSMKNDDKIKVYSRLDQLTERVVHIHGEVKRPGRYLLEDNLKLSDLILKAGNLKRNAYVLEAEIAKIDPKQATKFIKIDLQRLLDAKEAQYDLTLEEDDRVFIRAIPEWEVGPTVDVSGEVMFPGTYSITKDSTRLSEILRKTGGFTDEALIREAKLIRKGSKILIDKEYERLKQMSREQMTDSEYQYLVMKENTQDIGQVVVDFYKLVLNNDASEDVLLKNGDVIVVPKKPRVVYVTGRVSRPGGIIFMPGKKLDYYLDKAGGPSWDAHERKIKVTKVTGEILDDEDVRSFEPGDIVWVPRTPDRDWWEVFRQTMTVAAQIATVYLVLDRAVN